MSEIKKLTKKDIINGVLNTEWIYFTELKGELQLRPLTDAQWTKIESIRTRGVSISGMPNVDMNDKSNIDMSDVNLTMDLEKITTAEFEADCLALTYGLVAESDWTIEEVKNLQPAGIVRKIADKIYDLSGIKPKTLGTDMRSEAVKSFREK